MNSRSLPSPFFPVSPSPKAATLAQTADSQRWFVEEVQPHDAHLKAYLRSAFPSVNDVEDVVQESYLRLWRTRATQEVRSAKAFLFRVARNIAIDVLRQRRRLPRLGDFVAERVLEEKPSALRDQDRDSS